MVNRGELPWFKVRGELAVQARGYGRLDRQTEGSDDQEEGGGRPMSLSLKDAAKTVLLDVAEPLHRQEITKGFFESGLDLAKSEVPMASQNADLAWGIRCFGSSSSSLWVTPGAGMITFKNCEKLIEVDAFGDLLRSIHAQDERIFELLGKLEEMLGDGS